MLAALLRGVPALLGAGGTVNTTPTIDRGFMSLPAKAENVAVVRHALAGLAERMGMDEAVLADLRPSSPRSV